MAQFSIPATQKFVTLQRILWIDYAKGIGIFLVVLGHTLRGLINSSLLDLSQILTEIDQWIYAFHMPLFFFISGLFIHRATSKPFNYFVADKLKTIAYPYVVWSVLQSVIQAIVYDSTNHQTDLVNLWKIIYVPVEQFWFLYTLFVIMLTYAIAHKLGIFSNIFLIFSILLYLLGVLKVSLGSWGVLYLVRNYAIYFALGAVVGNKGLTVQLSQSKTPILGVVTVSGFLAVSLAVGLNLVEEKLAVPAVALLGIVASVALAILLERFDIFHFVEKWGRLSLQIYVAHTIASAGLRIGLQKLGFTEPITHFVFGTAIGIYAPTALDAICRQIGFRYMFTLRSR